jgi:hypothetical protein
MVIRREERVQAVRRCLREIVCDASSPQHLKGDGMTFLDEAKSFFGKVKNKVRANSEKAESDIDADPHVAHSRAGKDADHGDGTYVGRSGSDVALDVGESGAEARSEQKRLNEG